MGFYDAFFGSEQSQYTAYAIVAAIIAICITILLTATDVPVSNRLLIVFFVIISLVPSVFLTLFELTCIVTGGTEPNQWWCYAFAWVLAAFIIIYCIFIVIISLISLFNYNNAIDNVKETETNSRLSPEVSNNYAKQIIANEDKKTASIEKFYNDTAEDMILKSEVNVIKKQPEGDFNPLMDMPSVVNQMQSTTSLTTPPQNMSPPVIDHPNVVPPPNVETPMIATFANPIQKKEIAHFENSAPASKSKFSNFSELSPTATEDLTDAGFFPYEKFAAN